MINRRVLLKGLSAFVTCAMGCLVTPLTWIVSPSHSKIAGMIPLPAITPVIEASYAFENRISSIWWLSTREVLMRRYNLTESQVESLTIRQAFLLISKLQ